MFKYKNKNTISSLAPLTNLSPISTGTMAVQALNDIGDVNTIMMKKTLMYREQVMIISMAIGAIYSI